jgi:hypothetical protein
MMTVVLMTAAWVVALGFLLVGNYRIAVRNDEYDESSARDVEEIRAQHLKRAS